jgi:hypothetical protein
MASDTPSTSTEMGISSHTIFFGIVSFGSIIKTSFKNYYTIVFNKIKKERFMGGYYTSQ